MKKDLHTPLQNYVESAISQFDSISSTRKSDLGELADYISIELEMKKQVNLIFICTHNSRRSHLSQIWAQIGATYYGCSSIKTYSGGTEATAFYPSAVKALQKAGLIITNDGEIENPKYTISFGDNLPSIISFSKHFNASSNPQQDFVAIMTCSNADTACPIVAGAAKRFSIKYEDPKIADNTPNEESKYDERCMQIAIEMLYLFSQVNSG